MNETFNNIEIVWFPAVFLSHILFNMPLKIGFTVWEGKAYRPLFDGSTQNIVDTLPPFNMSTLFGIDLKQCRHTAPNKVDTLNGGNVSSVLVVDPQHCRHIEWEQCVYSTVLGAEIAIIS